MSKEEKKEDKSIEKEFKFSSSPVRQEGETYEEYKARRKLVKKLEKNRSKGKIFWPSGLMGTRYKEFEGHEENMINHTIDIINKQREEEDKKEPE